MIRPAASARSRRVDPTVLGLVLAALVGLPAPAATAAAAETLTDVLHAAWQHSAGIRSAAAQVSVTAESIPQAEAALWPQMNAVFGLGRVLDPQTSYNYFGPPSFGTDNYVVNSWTVNAEYTLYRGGSINAGIDKARAGTSAQRAALADSLQLLMLNAATAVADVILARQNVQTTRETLQGLLTQQDAVERAFNRQDSTRTDVDQTIDRVEGARSDLLQAEGQLIKASIAFQRWVGHKPAELAPLLPVTDLPPSRAAAVDEATESNPQVVRAQYNVDSAQADVAIARAMTLPTVKIVAQFSNELDFLIPNSSTTRSYSVGVQFVLPLYQGGAPSAYLGSSRDVLRQRQAQVVQARDQAGQNAADAWDSRLSALAALKARQTQRQASLVALEGLQREQQRGLRTVLDVLNGRRDVMSAEISLNQAQHDVSVAEFNLLAALGRMTPERYGISGTPAIDAIWDRPSGWSSVIPRLLFR